MHDEKRERSESTLAKFGFHKGEAPRKAGTSSHRTCCRMNIMMRGVCSYEVSRQEGVKDPSGSFYFWRCVMYVACHHLGQAFLDYVYIHVGYR